MPTRLGLQRRRRPVDSLVAGVGAVTRLAVGPEFEGVTGSFFDRGRSVRAHPQADDPVARQRLWRLSLALTGAPEPA
jgi:hypothetical protein